LFSKKEKYFLIDFDVLNLNVQAKMFYYVKFLR